MEGIREPLIVTARLRIDLADPSDAEDHVAYLRRNAAHLKPWEPTWPPDIFDPAARRRVLAQARDDAAADRAYRFFARLLDERAIVSNVNLSIAARGPFQACFIGYSVDGAQQGRGIGTEAVGAVVEYAFSTLRLHRVMANYIPTNERSGRLLRRLGFVPEGYARDYLCIDGRWRDHVLTSRVNANFAGGA